MTGSYDDTSAAEALQIPPDTALLPPEDAKIPIDGGGSWCDDALSPRYDVLFASHDAVFPSHDAMFPIHDGLSPIATAELPVNNVEIPARECPLQAGNFLIPDDDAGILATDAELPIESAATHARSVLKPLARASDPRTRRSIACAGRAFPVAHRFLPAENGSNSADGALCSSNDW